MALTVLNIQIIVLLSCPVFGAPSNAQSLLLTQASWNSHRTCLNLAYLKDSPVSYLQHFTIAFPFSFCYPLFFWPEGHLMFHYLPSLSLTLHDSPLFHYSIAKQIPLLSLTLYHIP